MRYFGLIQYNGTRYSGWQRQPNATTIQAEIEDTLSKVLRMTIEIVGCGRTDSGVHASEFYMHFDSDATLDYGFVHKLNGILSDDIVIIDIIPVHAEAHARYDAIFRSYKYFLTAKKDPFRRETVYHFPFFNQIEFESLQKASNLLLQYEDFFPFCKTKSDVKNYKCKIRHASWTKSGEGNELIFEISANRFLRGMVRLIVGMCLNVSIGKLTLDEVRDDMEMQRILQQPLSVKPHGLFLTEVRYPYIKTDKLP
ncbi:MAG: tRNA pseudouridine(38-40) synthase TruA [Bacteroidia bacterium]|nr:tRNA pseudouridine(38-40) synthase TruA [Bacteroidia bacterium]